MKLNGRFPIESQVDLFGVIANNSAKLAKANFGGVNYNVFIYLEMTDSNYKFCPSAHEWKNVNDISSFLGCFYRAICAFSGTKYLTSNL